MKISSLGMYFLAGTLLANSVPHLVIGVSGRRNMTPFGRDSSPLVNALWGVLNLAGGCLLVRRADKGADVGGGRDAWLPPLLAGSCSWSLFGLAYELRKRRSVERH